MSAFRFPSSRRAFSLVELLVVIAIISVLVALLLPALSAAKQSSVRTKCAANMRSLFQATYFYAQDNNEVIPYGCWFKPPPNYFGYISYSWDDLMAQNGYLGLSLSDNDIRYLGVVNYKIPRLQCPDDVRPGNQEYSNSGNIGWFITYAPNACSSSVAGPLFNFADGTGAYYQPTTPVRTNLNQITNASDTFLYVEYNSGGNYFGGGYGLCYGPSAQTGITLHGGILNYAYADGHVEAYKPAATIGNGNLYSPNGSWVQH